MPTIIRIGNVYSKLEGSFPRTEIDKELSFYTNGFFMSPLYNTCQRCKLRISQKTGRCPKCNIPRAWDGRKHLLLGGRTGIPYFPSGCLPIVARLLETKGIQPIWKDERGSHYEISPEAAQNVILRDPDNPALTRIPWKNQQDAIFNALKYQRGIIQTPTSGGKTTIMAALSKLIPQPTVILINNTSIAKQLRDEIGTMLGEQVGLIRGGVWEPARVTVAMTQSLTNALSLDKDSKKKKLPALPEAVELVKNTSMMMLDEAHHTSSQTWFTLTKEFENAFWRFGLTGTPFMRSSGDDLLLIGATGGLIYEVPEQELIKLGLIARPIIHFYKIDQPPIDDNVNYQTAYAEGVVNNFYMNKWTGMMVKKLYKEGAQILILAEHLEHISNLEKQLDGVEYEVLTGDSVLEERERVKTEFQEGKTQVILATKIFDEGVSIHNIDVVFRMGLLKTPIKTKQQVGRGQRVKKNKPNVVHIVDWLHTTHKYLAEHSYAHYESYANLGYEIRLEKEPFSLDCLEAENGTEGEPI